MSGDVPSNDSLHIATRLAQGDHFVDGGRVPSCPLSILDHVRADESYALPSEFSYARADNPNAHLLERLLADLEGGADRSYSVPAWRHRYAAGKRTRG